MTRKLTLSEYVKRRNGVPLGGKGSLANMLQRSFGADSFPKFWQYWNPIWGYYLGRNIYSPLTSVLPIALALILTFAVSGALHDLAVSLFKWQFVFFFTPWFSLMGVLVAVSKRFKLIYKTKSWVLRCVINIIFIIGCLALTIFLKA